MIITKKHFWLLSALLLISSSAFAADTPDRRTTTDAFEDWVINCVEQGKDKACEMKQSLLNSNKQLVAILSLAKKADGKMLFQLALPHLLDLTKPVSLTVDENRLAAYPYNFCNKTACFVIVADTTAMLKTFRKGSAGKIQAVTITGEPIALGFSLKGFSAAIDNLSTR